MRKFCLATATFLIAASGSLASTSLFEQGPNGLGTSTVASDSVDPAMFTQGDNFSLVETSRIESVTFTGSYQNSASFRPDSFTISIHADVAGLPAAVPLYSTTSASITRTPTGMSTLADYEATLPSAVTLDPGAYWLAIQNATSDVGSTVGRWGWARVNNDGDRARIFGSMSPDWEAIGNGDLVFALCGEPVIAELVHFWDFEGEGTDHAGSGDGAVGANAVFGEPGTTSPLFALGRSFERDGMTDPSKNIVVPEADVYEFGDGDFTISFAYKQAFGEDSTPTAGFESDWLFNCVDFGMNSGWAIRTLNNANHDAMEFVIRYGSGLTAVFTDDVVFATGDPSTAPWRHFTLVYDRSGTGLMRWYIDGEPSGFPAATTSQPILSPVDLEIGGFDTPSFETGADGAIDRVRIYNFALSDSQISQLAREVVLPDPGCQTDFDNNGATDSGDLATLLAAWGVCP